MADELTTKDVARLLHVSAETVRQYARDGRLPYEQTPGGHRRYDRGTVLRAFNRADVSLSVGPTTLNDIPAGATSINFEALEPANPMALEVASLASQERRPPLAAPSAPNSVHAALMRWAEPASVARAVPR
jgi:excisionase family DNA binding protein